MGEKGNVAEGSESLAETATSTVMDTADAARSAVIGAGVGHVAGKVTEDDDTDTDGDDAPA